MYVLLHKEITNWLLYSINTLLNDYNVANCTMYKIRKKEIISDIKYIKKMNT